MFGQYFTYWDDLPTDGGYPMFGKVHMAWLVCIGVGIALFVLWFLKRDGAVQKRTLKVLAVVMLSMEAYREIVLAATGHWMFANLPLHLCGLAIFVEVIFAFWPNKFLGELMCVACLPGAASALIFPDWLRYPTINYMNIHSFVMHGILVMFPLMALISGRYVPSIKRVYMPLIFFAVAVPILHWANTVRGTNFMFLNWPSTGTPFEAVYSAHGYGAYLAVYGATVLAVILLMYLGIFIVGSLAQKRQTPSM